MLIIIYQTNTEHPAVTFTINPMRRTNLHSNVEVFMLLTLCTNFEVSAHFGLQFSRWSCTFDICLANIFLKSLTNIFFAPLFRRLKHFEASALLCVVKGILLDIGLNLWHSLVLQSQISNFPYSLKNICLLCGIIFVEEFCTFTKRGIESASFLFSATHSTFCCSAKII